ncbi:MAG TPA: FxSxx-COOH system tetratricopeptide repeat protein [Actinocrinis sp.]|jgi:tetratricopeptide (TPR) repeat protein
MTRASDGQIVTFYSFKGGTGRTMALANIAWILAANGKRVLAVDWDLESPGLGRYFAPFLAAGAVRDTPGVIDLIRQFETEARRRVERRRPFEQIADAARIQPYAQSLNWTFPGEGTLDFVNSGRQNLDYATTIGNLGWDNFYDRLGGGALLDALREDMRSNYDYTLVDSRTGFSDIADICAIHLPDTLVNCFTLNTQGIEGAAQVAERTGQYPNRRIRVLPVPMRVENAERAKLESGRNLARQRFGDLPAELSAPDRADYWVHMSVPYQPFYAYEETLATFGDDVPGPTTLLAAYQRLTGYITRGAVTEMPPIPARLRESWLKRFERHPTVDIGEIVLDHEPEDDAWAEWIERVLSEAKITAVRAGDLPPDHASVPNTLTLSIVSPQYLRAREDGQSDGRASGGRATSDVRALYIADMRPLTRFPATQSEHVYAQPPAEGLARLTQLLGCAPLAEDAARRLAPHYPGNEPKINNLPPRNDSFTGRADALRALRDMLRSREASDGRPAVLHGLGGVGKTHLALEYAHRYKSEYDVVWWMSGGQPKFLDTLLTDLGELLATKFELQVGAGPGRPAEEVAGAVVEALARGDGVGRWLLVFDDARQPDDFLRFMPRGHGHVLVTTRFGEWERRGQLIDVNVFNRAESVGLLRRRAESLAADDADRVAAALGDLPLAVAMSAALFKQTGAPVDSFLRQLEQHGPVALAEAGDAQYGTEASGAEYSRPVAAAWDLSFAALRENSEAAYRLLELCSVMSADGIGFDLVYCPAMVDALAPLDPTLIEAGDVARLVNQMNRLALVRLDSQNRQIQMHRLVQQVVRSRLSTADLDETRHEVHKLLASSRPRRDVDDPDTWRYYRVLWPHLEPSQAERCLSEPVRSLLVDRVRYVWMRGPLTDAEETGRAIERTWTEHLDRLEEGPEKVSLRKQFLHLRFNLANALRDLAKYDEALDLDGQVLAEQTRLLGPEHRQTLMTAGSVAADLRAGGRYQEALELAEDTYRTWAAVFGDDFPRTLDAANNYAISLRLAGRYAHASTLDEAVYERRRIVLRPLHPRTLISANSVGRNLREAGRYVESVAWLEEQLALCESEPEPNPRILAEIQVNLSASLRAVGRHAEVVPHLDAAYATMSAIYGESHVDTLACRLSRAANLLATGENMLADQEMRNALVTYEETLGADHPNTLLCASNHVTVLRSNKALGEALRTARNTVARLTQRLGPDYPYTLAATMNLAVCLADQGDTQESLALDRDTTRRMDALLGENHPDSLRAHANLALTRRQLDEPKADQEFASIVERLAGLIGIDHPSLIALRSGNRVHRVLDPQPI